VKKRVVYVRFEAMEDEDAEDCTLGDFTVKGLFELVRSSTVFQVQQDLNEKSQMEGEDAAFTLFISKDHSEWIKVTEDTQVVSMVEDSMIIVKWAGSEV